MTFASANRCFVYATADLGRSFQSYNRRSTTAGNLLLYAGVFLLVIAALALLAYWDRRRKMRIVERDAELILFRSLCRLHCLEAADIDLLAKLASAKKLPRRSDLFIDPTPLAALARRSGPHAARYAHLHRTLFGIDPIAAA